MCLGCRVKGLPTKKKYRFRVLAENLSGPGKPSPETEPVLIKDPIGMTCCQPADSCYKPRPCKCCAHPALLFRPSMGSW